PMLAHIASAEGTAAVERMAGLESHVDYEAVPSCIFTFPEIAAVGLTEEEMETRGLETKIGKFPFIANGKAAAMGEKDGFVKVIADTDHVIRGIHIVGPHASDLIQEAAVIVRNRMQLDDVINTIHPHPTLGEALYEAVLDAAGRAVHLVSRP
ncbi:MAG TPA: dihydrolipoyl dehydrogenase, partial [Peptococcaceae bacterium]|nr:dihydrolipoyl dehydrogenase [Peptococcaceae bacterium]